jgi:hypothetical protein
VFQDSAKRLGLLFGMLVILIVYAGAVTVHMLWTRSAASLLELILFALLTADAVVLLLAVRNPVRPNPGLLQYLSVWILGLIPYFGWVIVYGAGKGIAQRIERGRANPRAIAVAVLLGILLLCASVYLVVGNSRTAATPT